METQCSNMELRRKLLEAFAGELFQVTNLYNFDDNLLGLFA